MKKRNPWAWVPSIYFAEGIPYVTVMTVSLIMYKRMGLSNTEITLYTSWLYLPWVIKPFWSPFVDIIKSKRWWVTTMQLLIGAALGEIRAAINATLGHRRFICQHMAELLLSPEPDHREEVNLTKTETEVLKDIALGLTTKEIASKRFSSFHTINTHRKNIFRKLGVNNAHEATKYALRAGLVDSAEYYI